MFWVNRWFCDCTGYSGNGSFNNRSPNISSQYLANLCCWIRQQWFSKESTMGQSLVTKAQSRIAYITSLNRMSVHIAIPWVIIGSSSSPLPSQQSSSTHLRKKHRNSKWKSRKNCFFFQIAYLQPARRVCLYISTELFPPNCRPEIKIFIFFWMSLNWLRIV